MATTEPTTAAPSPDPFSAFLTGTAPCPVAYCRAEAGHRDLHDIPPCLNTCEWVVVGVNRKHDNACPNAAWRRP